jgi:decaprenyl-phosphate phosphoribosyltransferase
MTEKVTFKDYIKIARPDHWFKNIFVLPGLFVGLTLSHGGGHLPYLLLLSLISVCLICSANYTINEWIDRDFDRHHPTKKKRPCVVKGLKPLGVYTQYAVLSVLGLFLAYQISSLFLLSSAFLLIMGILDNVPPFRTKERPYLDVLSESINNPIRFLLGWAIVVKYHLPPSSILLAYWMGGAFLMGIKRYAEYRSIGDRQTAVLYRKSFAGYTEEKLLVSCFFYAICSAFFTAIFLIKYRIEYLLLFPLIAGLFAWYLYIGLLPDSAAQFPEKMYKQKAFWSYVGMIAIATMALTFIDMPSLKILLNNSLIPWFS